MNGSNLLRRQAANREPSTHPAQLEAVVIPVVVRAPPWWEFSRQVVACGELELMWTVKRSGLPGNGLPSVHRSHQGRDCNDDHVSSVHANGDWRKVENWVSFLRLRLTGVETLFAVLLQGDK